MTDKPSFDFAGRRARVLAALGDRAALVLPATPELTVGRDTELRYVVDPDLWYLTGYTEPEAVAVLTGSGDAPFTLFVRPRDPDRETWTGPRAGIEAATGRFDADAAHPIAELRDRLPQLLRGVDRVYFPLGRGRDDVERLVLDVVAHARHTRQRSGRGPSELADPGLLLDDFRLVKDPAEIAAIREAVRVTIEGIRAGLAAARDGAGEWEVEAAAEGTFRRLGASGPAFPTIAASGPNACVLHHVANDRAMRAGELLLLDAGARVGMYAGDLTRTVAVGGTLEGAAKEAYDVVAAANRAAIAAVRPGATLDDVHDAALQVLLEGMRALGLPLGEDDADGKRWYPHRTSHWLGLDVHDVGTYATHGTPRPLQPGMVLTVEPGLYIPAHEETAPAYLRGIGIRLEDDLLVVEGGAEVLSSDL